MKEGIRLGLGIGLIVLALAGLVVFLRVQRRIYRAMRQGLAVDVRRESRRLFLSNAVTFLGWWLSGALMEGGLAAELLPALGTTGILFLLSGVALGQMRRYQGKRSIGETEGND